MKKPLVLIIEDNQELNAEWLLITEKHFISYCCTSDQIKKYLNNYAIDVIVMNFDEREESESLGIIHEIKEIEEYSRIPLICLSKKIDSPLVKDCFDAGIDMFLPRPIKSDHLKTVIQVYAERKF